MYARCEEWPLKREFRIARCTISVARPVVVELHDGSFVGRGECEAHETDQAAIGLALQQLEQLREQLEKPGFSRAGLQSLLPACPIRNAIDCASWDLEAKRNATAVWRLARLPRWQPVTTAYTLSIDEPDRMGEQAARLHGAPLLKIKLGGNRDLECVRAVRQAAPHRRLIVDANEAWSFDDLRELAPRLHGLGVELIEQPLPRGLDAPLRTYQSPVPLCADESCTDLHSLPEILGKYQFVNIKLDKTGGLTEAIALYRRASSAGLRLMVGCMVGTSLAMAPALVLAGGAEFVDLDGPLLLRADRQPALVFDGMTVSPPTAALWG